MSQGADYRCGYAQGKSQGRLTMATERDYIRELIDKLEELPPERIAEVEDFIDFLNSRAPDRRLTQAASKVAEPSLSEIWDNPDDDVYDQL
jgi:hypothetical protein